MKAKTPKRTYVITIEEKRLHIRKIHKVTSYSRASAQKEVFEYFAGLLNTTIENLKIVHCGVMGAEHSY